MSDWSFPDPIQWNGGDGEMPEDDWSIGFGPIPEPPEEAVHELWCDRLNHVREFCNCGAWDGDDAAY